MSKTFPNTPGYNRRMSSLLTEVERTRRQVKDRDEEIAALKAANEALERTKNSLGKVAFNLQSRPASAGEVHTRNTFPGPSLQALEKERKNRTRVESELTILKAHMQGERRIRVEGVTRLKSQIKTLERQQEFAK